jgi:phosphoribosyl-AMP cyclohydrolase
MPFDRAAIANLTYNESGLIPAIVQSATTGRVLMMAWMNHESLLKTIAVGETVFFSRSRSELWHKGATSGNTQKVKSIEADCDADTLLIKVLENGPACHTDAESCFDVSTFFFPPDTLETNDSDGGAVA